MGPESQGPDPPPPGIRLRVRCSRQPRAQAGVGEVLPSLRPLSPAASGGGHPGPEPRDSAARGRLRPTPPVPRPPRAGLYHPSRAPRTAKDHVAMLRARFPPTRGLGAPPTLAERLLGGACPRRTWASRGPGARGFANWTHVAVRKLRSTQAKALSSTRPMPSPPLFPYWAVNHVALMARDVCEPRFLHP